VKKAEAVLTAFARTQLKAWLDQYAPRLNKRRRLVVQRAIKTVEVRLDFELVDGDTDAYMYFSRPLVLYVAPNAESLYPDLIDHELAHFICMLRWRDGGHGQRFTRTTNQIRTWGMK